MTRMVMVRNRTQKTDAVASAERWWRRRAQHRRQCVKTRAATSVVLQAAALERNRGTGRSGTETPKTKKFQPSKHTSCSAVGKRPRHGAPHLQIHGAQCVNARPVGAIKKGKIQRLALTLRKRTLHQSGRGRSPATTVLFWRCRRRCSCSASSHWSAPSVCPDGATRRQRVLSNMSTYRLASQTHVCEVWVDCRCRWAQKVPAHALCYAVFWNKLAAAVNVVEGSFK